MSVSPATEAWSSAGTPRPDGRRVGVLLCHGFTGSPASVRPWGESLAAQGYAVTVPRLPGHGTTWQEMNRTSWQQWYGEVERAFDGLRRDCDSVVVGGLSMGATLSLLLAAERGAEVAGVVSVNVSIDNKDPRRFAAPIIKRLVPSLAGIADDIKKPGVTEGGYDRLPTHAAHELLRLYSHLRPRLPQVTQPLLVVRSAVDHVADPGSHRLLLASVSSRDVTEVTLEDSYHVATLDNDAPLIEKESLAFVERVSAPEPVSPS